MATIDLPDFMGIGAEKAASTWLYTCLHGHPDICMSERKELRFFDSDSNYAKGLADYAYWFSDCPVGTRKGEFSPTYLASRVAPERIRRDCGAIQFIVTLRDPIERVKSHAHHWIRKGRIRTTNLGEAIEKEPVIVEKSKYYSHLVNYFQYFDIGSFWIVAQEQISGSEVEVLESLWNFLGVRQDHTPKQATQAVSQGYVPRYQALERLKYSTHQELKRTRWGNRVVNMIRQAGISGLYRRVNSTASRLDYSHEDLKRLREEFHREYEDLPQLIGEDLSMWPHENIH